MNEKTVKDVQHSRCGCWIKMKEPYNTLRFQDHVNKQCDKCPPTASVGVPSISEWQHKFNISFQNSNKLKPKQLRPCLGVMDSNHSHVTTYLGRTGALGGGARSVTKIAKEWVYKTVQQTVIEAQEGSSSSGKSEKFLICTYRTYCCLSAISAN